MGQLGQGGSACTLERKKKRKKKRRSHIRRAIGRGKKETKIKTEGDREKKIFKTFKKGPHKFFGGGGREDDQGGGGEKKNFTP